MIDHLFIVTTRQQNEAKRYLKPQSSSSGPRDFHSGQKIDDVTLFNL